MKPLYMFGSHWCQNGWARIAVSASPPHPSRSQQLRPKVGFRIARSEP